MSTVSLFFSLSKEPSNKNSVISMSDASTNFCIVFLIQILNFSFENLNQKVC